MLNPYNCNFNPMNPKHQALNASQFVGFTKPAEQLWINAAVKKFGYVYDEKMDTYSCPYDPTVVDKPGRCKIIHDALQHDGLLKDAVKIEARPATDDELALVHTRDFIKQAGSLSTPDQCEAFCKDKELLWMSPDTEKAARLAVGSVLETVKASVEGRIGNGFAIVRPQGHAAHSDQPQAYCLYNNVAIAAKYATTKLGLDRVAVVDLDIHAPTGTYMALRDTVQGNSNKSKTCLFSIHAYYHGLFWPYTQDFDYDPREGNVMFFPLNAPLTSEGEYLAAFNHAILPSLREYKPQLILLSAGFDSGYCDSMFDAGQALRAHGWAHIARDLHEIAQDRVVAVLEGGDHPLNLQECSTMMVKGLQCKATPRVHHPDQLSGHFVESVFSCLIHNKDRWRWIVKHLEKLQGVQHKNGFPEYTLPPQRLFLGHGIRDMWEDVKAAKLCRTRGFIHPMSPEMAKLADERINEYKKRYAMQPNELVPEQYMVNQMLYDEKAKADSYLKSSQIVALLYSQYMEFKTGKAKTFLICDRDAMSLHKNLKKYVS